jgi:hypothetical protein
MSFSGLKHWTLYPSDAWLAGLIVPKIKHMLVMLTSPLLLQFETLTKRAAIVLLKYRNY